MMVITISSGDPKSSLRPRILRNSSSGFNVVLNNQHAIFFEEPVYNLKENLDQLIKVHQLTFLTAPKNFCTEEFLKEFKNELKRFSTASDLIKYLSFRTADDIFSEFNRKKLDGTLMIGIIFHNGCYDFETFLQDFLVTIRTLGPATIDFKRLFPDKLYSGPSNESFYLGNNQLGFIETQNFLNLAYLKITEKIAKREEIPIAKRFEISNIIMYKYPFLDYLDNPPVTLLDIIPSVVVYSFIIFFPLIVKQITTENQNRVRDMFKLMGLNDLAFYGSTFLIYFIEFIIQASLLTFLYTFKFSDKNPAALNNANPLLVFLLLLVYGMNLILIGIFLSIFFNKANIAVISAIVTYLLCDILHYFIDPKYNKAIKVDSTGVQMLQISSCVLPVPSIKFAMRLFTALEQYSSGASFGHIFETTYQYGSLSLGLILIMNSCSVFINIILIYYLKNVWPFQYGLVKPWFFPLNPILKLFKKNENQNHQMVIDETKTESTFIEPKYFEEDTSKTKVKVSLQNLYKKYGKRTVISDINLNLHENQLTALLGHNSAGKTTLMNIITGLTPATNGKVLIDGFDLQKNFKKARKSISLCPQHNILYDELTAYEHLMIYGTIKGKSTRKELEQEIEGLLDQLYLKSKKNLVSACFSGGMKRKLTLAIALIGKSEIVILDEPTAGIDSESRRAVWDVLLKEKRSRTILLTTHFIEESDVLGDKIFILSNGKARCHGSPLFLKNIFGMGYQLRITKDHEFNVSEEAHEKLNKFITKFFKKATILDENVGEIVYSLDKSESSSKEETGTSIFTEFFTEFEKERTNLHIGTFGITLITLEDVFLKILYLSQYADQEMEENLSSSDVLKNNIVEFFEDKKRTNIIKNKFELFYQRFKALILKRFHHSKRHYPTLIFQLLIPISIFWLILYLDYYLKPTRTKKELLKLDSDLYGESRGFFKDNTSDPDLFESYNRTSFNSSMKVFKLNWNENPNRFLVNESTQQNNSIFVNSNLFGCIVVKLNDSTKERSVFNLEIWFNNEITHSLPLSISSIYTALLDYQNGVEMENLNEVKIINEPFRNPMSIESAFQIIKGLKTMWDLLISVSLPFLAASYSLFPIMENISKSKLLQKMSGSTSCLYWSTTFIFDLISHTILCSLILLIFYFQDVKLIFIHYRQSIIAVFLLLFMFGLTSIQICYAFSRIFKSLSAGFLAILAFNLIFGVMLGIIDFFVDYLDDAQKLNVNTLNIIRWHFRMFPIYSAARGISNLYEIGSKSQLCEEVGNIDEICGRSGSLIENCCPNCTENCFRYENPLTKWHSNGVLMEIVSLSAVFLFGLLLNLVLEEHIFLKAFSIISKFKWTRIVIVKPADYYLLENAGEDADVIQEKKRVDFLVDNSRIEEQAMIVHHLSKAFNKFIAVNDLSFVLGHNECFGLLGVNGAGKTTTFRMLVGDLEPTEGTAYINNLNLKNLKKFQKNIGYCPQFDALLDNLTGEEMLYLFGRLRGIREKYLEKTVDYIIKMVDLTKHAKFVCSNYSGGNKRKLSLAIALIGLPKIIFLDEPTAGVDPEARRKIWNTLVSVKEKFNCSIVLTSHSMDECESLCSRIAIMVAGKFKCLNSVQNLRQKYGRGYTLTIKLKPVCLDQPMYLEKLRQKILEVFPSAKCKDFHGTLLDYRIEDTGLKWSFLFHTMDEIRHEFNLDYYLLSDTTLESIFINFAKEKNKI